MAMRRTAFVASMVTGVLLIVSGVAAYVLVSNTLGSRRSRWQTTHQAWPGTM